MVSKNEIGDDQNKYAEIIDHKPNVPVSYISNHMGFTYLNCYL
jgi:hypothetical protein